MPSTLCFVIHILALFTGQINAQVNPRTPSPPGSCLIITDTTCPGISSGCCPLGACCGAGCCSYTELCVNSGTASAACCDITDPTLCRTASGVPVSPRQSFAKPDITSVVDACQRYHQTPMTHVPVSRTASIATGTSFGRVLEGKVAAQVKARAMCVPIRSRHDTQMMEIVYRHHGLPRQVSWGLHQPLRLMQLLLLARSLPPAHLL